MRDPGEYIIQIKQTCSEWNSVYIRTGILQNETRHKIFTFTWSMKATEAEKYLAYLHSHIR